MGKTLSLSKILATLISLFKIHLFSNLQRFWRGTFYETVFLLPKGSGYSKRKWSDTSVFVLTTRHFISVSVSPNNSLTLTSRSKPLIMSVIRTSKPPKYSHPGSSMYIVLSLVDFYREILIRFRSTFFIVVTV